MKNIKFVLGILFILSLFIGQISYAEGEIVRLTIKNNGNVVYSDNLNLPVAGIISINDTDGVPHDIEARSVLNIINIADAASSSFNISNLMYYSSFSAFYLKCITIESSLCDNWQYKVNDVDPGIGMDSSILSGGENVVLFFGDENPAPEPVIVRQSSGGGLLAVASSISQAMPVSVPLTITPEIEKTSFTEIKNTEVILPVVETPKEVVKKIEKKKIVKKVKVQNAASVINSPEVIKNTETVTPVVKKKNWFRRLFNF